jgi:tryptophan synthase alpha chain
VTGAAHLDPAAVRERLARVRKHTTLPLGVGFGIGDPAAARQVSEFADAVIVGSAVVRRLADAPDTAAGIAAVSAFVRSLRRAMDNPQGETKIA